MDVTKSNSVYKYVLIQSFAPPCLQPKMCTILPAECEEYTVLDQPDRSVCHERVTYKCDRDYNSVPSDITNGNMNFYCRVIWISRHST